SAPGGGQSRLQGRRRRAPRGGGVSRSAASGPHPRRGAQCAVHLLSQLRDSGDLRSGVRRIPRPGYAGTHSRLRRGAGSGRRPAAGAAAHPRVPPLRGGGGQPAVTLAAAAGAAGGERRAVRCLSRAHPRLARRRAAAHRPRSAFPPEHGYGAVARAAVVLTGFSAAPAGAATAAPPPPPPAAAPPRRSTRAAVTRAARRTPG